MTGALRIDGGELPSTDGVRAPHIAVDHRRTLRAARDHPHVVGPRGPRRRQRARTRAGGDGGEPRRLARRAAARDLRAAAGARPDQAGDVRGTARPLPAGRGADRARPLPRRRGRDPGRGEGAARRAWRRRVPRRPRGAGDMASPRAGAAYLALVTGAPGRARWRSSAPGCPGRRRLRAAARVPPGDDLRRTRRPGQPRRGPAPSRTWPTPPPASPTPSCRPSARPSR